MQIDNVNLKWLGHAGFLIENGKTIYIDPYNVSSGEKADIILITHPHHDHCSIEDIEKILKAGTIVVVPADCQSKIARLENIDMRIVDAGQTLDLGDIKLGTVPSYNINKEFHSKSERWLGYVIKIGSVVIYHAGDTDLIPEMGKLNGKVTVALLPVGGTYTMTAEQAAEAASVINPEFAIPMHYGDVAGSLDDAERFVNLCSEKGINAEVLEQETR